VSDPRIKPRVPSVNHEHPLANGLVGAWAFQDGGGSVLRDVSGQGLDGTLVSGPVWGKSSEGYELDYSPSTSAKVTIPNSAKWAPKLEYDRQWSVGLRISVGAVSGLQWLFSTSNPSSPYNGIDLILESGTPHLRVEVGNSWPGNYLYARTSNPLPVSYSSPVPVQLLMVYAGHPGTNSTAQLSLYIDGVKIPMYSAGGSDALSATIDVGLPICIGGRNASSYGWSGTILDARIWQRAIGPSEAASLYYDSWSLYRQPEPALASAPAGGFFEFDQLTGGMPDLRGGMV
jgi:hypothetical protein